MKKTFLVFTAAISAAAICLLVKAVGNHREGDSPASQAEPASIAEHSTTPSPTADGEADAVGEDAKGAGGGPLDRLLKDIVDGKAKTVAKSVRFPFGRECPIPPVLNEEDFVARFDEIFDKPFRRMLGKLPPGDCWDEVGSRGTMLAHGILWIDGTIADGGKIIALNHQSEAEQKLRKRLVEEERKTLPPYLAEEGCDTKLCFETEDGTIAGRVDDIGNRHFRIALFAMPFHSGDNPVATFRGTVVWEGSGGNHSYLDDEGRWALSVNVIGPPDSPDFHLMERDSWQDAFDYEAARRCRSSSWPEILAKGTH